jgi:hypothetical protein
MNCWYCQIFIHDTYQEGCDISLPFPRFVVDFFLIGSHSIRTWTLTPIYKLNGPWTSDHMVLQMFRSVFTLASTSVVNQLPIAITRFGNPLHIHLSIYLSIYLFIYLLCRVGLSESIPQIKSNGLGANEVIGANYTTTFLSHYWLFSSN